MTDPPNAFLYLEAGKNIEEMYISHPVIWPNYTACTLGKSEGLFVWLFH
jgi:hypothetical protein